MAARTLSCFEKTKPKNKKQQHVIHSLLPNETIAPFKAPQPQSLNVSTWHLTEGNRQGTSRLSGSVHTANSLQMGYWAGGENIFSDLTRNLHLLPRTIKHHLQYANLNEKVYRFWECTLSMGTVGFYLAWLPKFCFRATLKFPNKLCSIPLSSTWLENGLEGIKPVTDYTDISFLDISRLESNIFYSLSCTHFNLFSRRYKGFFAFFLTKLRRSNFQSTDVCYLLSNKDSKYLPVVLPAQQQWFAPNGRANILIIK